MVAWGVKEQQTDMSKSDSRVLRLDGVGWRWRWWKGQQKGNGV